MRTMIVDDEVPALKMLEKLVVDHDKLTLVYSTHQAETVLAKLEDVKPELILLDINMGGISGVDLAEEINRLEPSIQIIFITAYSEYAVKAFELNALDYLLKPVTKKRFNQGISRISFEETQTITSSDKIKMAVFGEGLIMDYKGVPIELRTKKAYELLFLLRHHFREGVTKDVMMEKLWEHQTKESSTMMLHTTIYQIRQSFKKAGLQNPIQYKQGRYYLILEVEHDLDVVEEMIQKEPSLEGTEYIISTYVGLYLEQEHVEWASIYRNDLHQRVLEYIMYSIKSDAISYINLHTFIERNKEDVISKEQCVEEILNYYDRHHYKIEAQIFGKRVLRHWETELHLPLPLGIEKRVN